MPETLLIGLTGGPACGKSAALDAFSKIGWRTLCADKICHEIYASTDNDVARAIAARWGDAVIAADGTVDRRAVAGIVFKDGRELEWLEELTHPAVLREIGERTADGVPTVVEIPLLFEGGFESRFLKTVAVWSPGGIQEERMAARGWSVEHAKSRAGKQLTAAAKLEKADFGIVNIGTLEFLFEQCTLISNQIKGMASEWTKTKRS